MENFNLIQMKKRGQTGINNKVTYLIGALIVIVLAVSLSGEMFSGVTDLERTYNETTGVCLTNCNTPEWIPTVLFVIIGAGIVFLIWRAFGNN